MTLSSNVVYLISAGIVLVPVLQWSDVLTGWFKKIIPASTGTVSGLIWTLVITAVGALILWGLSKLDRKAGSSDFFTSVFGILALAVVFFVASIWSDYLGALFKGFFGGSDLANNSVMYAIVVTLLAMLLLWLLGKITPKGPKGAVAFTASPVRTGSPGRVRVTATPLPTAAY